MTDKADEDNILPIGTVVHDRWQLLEKIGSGGFGQIFLASDRSKVSQENLVAVKLEKLQKDKNVLKMEVAVLKSMRGCGGVPRLLDCGRTTTYNFMTMNLSGRNISDLRKSSVGARFDLRTVCYVTAEVLKAIRDLHDRGVLHRDIKTSNIVVGYGDDWNKIMLIDFGLARVYMTSTGEVRPPRESAGFRGTARFASLNAHRGKELARRDDLWSLLYAMNECARGMLPWRSLSDKREIYQLKTQYPFEILLQGMPRAFFQMAEHVDKLRYEDRPDYSMLIKLFEDDSRDSKGRYPPRRLAWSATEAPVSQRGHKVRGDRKIKEYKPSGRLSRSSDVTRRMSSNAIIEGRRSSQDDALRHGPSRRTSTNADRATPSHRASSTTMTMSPVVVESMPGDDAVGSSEEDVADVAATASDDENVSDDGGDEQQHPHPPSDPPNRQSRLRLRPNRLRSIQHDMAHDV